jgi:2-methylcitrate dehydratase PrpD
MADTMWNGFDRRRFLKGVTLGALGGGTLLTSLTAAGYGANAPTDESAPMRDSVREIAQWVASMIYEDIPARVLQKAKYQLLNILAAIHAGYKYPPGRAVVDTVLEWKGQGASTIVPLGVKTSANNAAFANATLSICYDFDDYLFLGHTGHSAVAVPLALAEQLKLGFKDVLLAQVIANEIEGRVGASILFGKMNGQLWSSIHAIGAAAAAAKLLGLDTSQIEHAIGIAMFQPPWGQFPGFFGPDSKLLTASNPTLMGLIAAQLAGKGLTGSPLILNHRQGFVNNFSCLPMPFMLTGWGRTWVTDTVAFKIYPGDAYIDTVIDALMKILDQYESAHGTRRIPPDQIRRIEIDANLLTVATEHLAREYTDYNRLTPINVNFTLLLNVAIALLAGRFTTDQLALETLEKNRRQIIALRERMVLRHDLPKTIDMFQTVQQTVDVGRVFGQFDLLELAKGIGCMLDFYRLDLSGASDLPSEIETLINDLARNRTQAEFDLGDYHLEQLRLPFAADVKITLTDGQVLQATQRIPFGAPGAESQEATFRRVEDKFRYEAAALLPDDRIDEVLSAVRQLEEIDDVSGFLAAASLPG